MFPISFELQKHITREIHKSFLYHHFVALSKLTFPRLTTFSAVILVHIRFPAIFSMARRRKKAAMWKICKVVNVVRLPRNRTMLATLIVHGTKILTSPAIFSWPNPFLCPSQRLEASRGVYFSSSVFF